MAIKYVRPDRPRRTDPSYYAPPGLVRRLGQIEPRQRLIIVYVGVSLVAALALVFHMSLGRMGFDNRPVISGEGVVTGKSVSEGPEPEYCLEIEVYLAGGGTSAGTAMTSQEVWERLAVGDRVGVRYQRSWSGRRIRIRETGVVALPGPIQ